MTTLIRGQYKGYTLLAPKEWFKLSPKEQEAYTNGCGPKGFWWLVPDTMWGLCVTPACDIHDYMYLTWGNKDQSDLVFLKNLLTIIDAESPWYLRWLRRLRAQTYYLAVSIFGGGFTHAS